MDTCRSGMITLPCTAVGTEHVNNTVHLAGRNGRHGCAVNRLDIDFKRNRKC